MNCRLSLILLFFFGILLFSCNKKEQSCTDGIYDETLEEKTDCGGVCPPCNYTPTVLSSFVNARLNDEYISFKKYKLLKNDDFLFQFSADSVEIQLNFGSINDLGAYSIEKSNSFVKSKDKMYSELSDGLVLIYEWEKDSSFLSGYFEADFLLDDNNFDTFKITSGEFMKVFYE